MEYQIVLMVLALTACVLAIVFIAAYWINKSVR